MEWVRFQLEPRDRRAAARTAAWIYVVSASVVFVSSLLIESNSETHYVALIVPVPLLIIGGLLAWPRFPYTRVLLLITPMIAIGFITFLNLATHDASAAAQVAFCLPVLFAASQLRFLGAGLAVVASIIGDALIVWRLRPNGGGVFDLIDVSLVLLLMTGLLAQSGRRQDRLVALLESQASHDPLTGLVTRRVLDEAVHRALTAPAVHSGTALILVDVDHFKSINDSYGHPVGDDALIHVATVLQRQSRPDTVISRLGGDEIAVLLTACTETVARHRAHDFLRAMRDSPLMLPDGRPLSISISVGVAHVPLGERHLRELYAAADASLYDAKRAGRGRVGQPARGHPVFVNPVELAGPAASVAADPATGGSQRVPDGPFEVRDMPDGVVESRIGRPGDDRVDHR